MPEVCFLTGRPETQCKRKRLLNTLKTMVTHLEQDQKRECLVPKLVAKGDSCLCPGGRGRIPSFWLKETVCLDGKKAIPRKNDIVQPRKWVPACTSPRPMLDSSMSCYCATLGSDLCSGGFRCECECGVGSHVHIPPRGALRKGGVPSVKDTVEGHCTRPADLSCPAKDTHHDHWSPEVGACRHPNMCRSDCFDHNPAKDFVDARARYKFYLESCKNKLYC